MDKNRKTLRTSSRRARRRWAVCLLAWLALLLSASPADADNFGDITVTLEDEPQGISVHGYFEVWLRVENKAEHAAHQVQLSIKMPAFSYKPEKHTAFRNLTIEAGKSVRVPLSLPYPQPSMGYYSTADGIAVVIDSNEPKTVKFTQQSSYRTSAMSTPFNGMPLVLCSQATENLADLLKVTRSDLFDGRTAMRLAPVPGSKTGPEPPLKIGLTAFAKTTLPVAAWSPDWLGYSRYDGIILAADELLAMPAEVREAIGQYVECGGTLLVLGPGAQLPGKWKPQRFGKTPLWGCPVGFGQVFVCDEKNLSQWQEEPLVRVISSWTRSLEPWMKTKSTQDANQKFPVIEETGVPVMGLLALMTIFTVIIGPLNFYFLTRRRRKLWLFWTVPLISLTTCLIVIGYVFLSEGWSGRSRVEGFTILDETNRRASTIGCFGIYTAFTPSEGLHFSTQTEIVFRDSVDPDPYGYSSYRSHSRFEATNNTGSLDWTRDQNLISGWVSPRIPAHFVVRKSETRRERITFGRSADGRPEAVNGLGADLTELWYSDEKGTLFHAAEISAGARATLNPGTAPTLPLSGRIPTLREVYLTDPLIMAEEMKKFGPLILTPKSYLAVMESAPFLGDEVLKGTRQKAQSVVFGILKEGNDGD